MSCKTCHFNTCRCEDLQAGYMGFVSSAGWPMKSDALAVHPDQIPEAMERNKKHGIEGVSYLKDGRAVLDSRKARQRLMALEGVHDNNGGYGDDHAGQSPLYRTDTVPFIDGM